MVCIFTTHCIRFYLNFRLIERKFFHINSQIFLKKMRKKILLESKLIKAMYYLAND